MPPAAASSLSTLLVSRSSSLSRHATSSNPTLPLPSSTSYSSSLSTLSNLPSPSPLPSSSISSSHSLDFYSTLLSAGVFYLWHQTPLPTSSSQCATLYGLSLTQWIRHFLITTKLPMEQFYLALKWIQLLTNRFPKLTKLCKPGSELRVFIAALILTNKYFEDHYISKKSWSKVSQVSLLELNQMELELLEGLQWDLSLSQDDYLQWMQWMQRFKRYWEQHIFKPHNYLPLSPCLEKGKSHSTKKQPLQRMVATSSSS